MSTGKNPNGGDLIEDLKVEVVGMAKDGAKHPSTKPVLTGMAIGAAAGWILPVVSLPLGALAGAGFMLYKRVRP